VRIRPSVDPDGAPPVPLAVQHRDRTDIEIDVLGTQGQSFADPQPGSVQQHDQRPMPDPVSRRRRTLGEQRPDFTWIRDFSSGSLAGSHGGAGIRDIADDHDPGEGASGAL